MKCAVLFGTRPEIIKLFPVITELKKRHIDTVLIHSNQHYSYNMDRLFLEELNIPEPNYNLEVSKRTHAGMTAEIMEKTETILQKEKPDILFVQGDTNTVLAGAITASKIGISVAHVEAGLRSYDRSMPEEINRVVTDHVSSILFAPTKLQKKILKDEKVSGKIFVTGNTIVDSLKHFAKIAKKQPALKYQKGKYAVLTLHRPSNVDQPAILKRIMSALDDWASKNDCPILFPVHPRTAKNIKNFNVNLRSRNIKCIDPAGYLAMIHMLINATIVFTDSGGIQEESCVLGTPCVTLRDNTERPETVDVGSNIVVGTSKQKIFSGASKMLSKRVSWKNPFGDGTAGKKIVNIIERYS